MIYHPTYIEVKAVRLLGGKAKEAIDKLNDALEKCSEKEVNPELSEKIYINSRRLYRVAVRSARQEGWKL